MRAHIYLISLIAVTSYSVVAQQTINLDDTTAKKIRETQRLEENRKKMQTQMHVTRSDSGIKLPQQSPSAENGKCKLDPEQMKQFANSVDASRGKAGVLQMPVLINQARQIDKQCEQQKLPQAFQKKVEPKAMHSVQK